MENIANILTYINMIEHAKYVKKKIRKIAF